MEDRPIKTQLETGRARIAGRPLSQVTRAELTAQMLKLERERVNYLREAGEEWDQMTDGGQMLRMIRNELFARGYLREYVPTK